MITVDSRFFTEEELQCRCGCNLLNYSNEFLIDLFAFRNKIKCRMKVNSGCRCKAHNKAEGGSTNSQHLYGRAADIRVAGVDASEVYEYLDTKYTGRYGVGKYNGRTHIDVRSGPATRWDMT